MFFSNTIAIRELVSYIYYYSQPFKSVSKYYPLIIVHRYNVVRSISLNLYKVSRQSKSSKNLLILHIFFFTFQERERPEYAVELRKANQEYEKTRNKLMTYFGKYYIKSLRLLALFPHWKLFSRHNFSHRHQDFFYFL